MEAVNTSETSVYCNETTRRYIPEYYYLQLQIHTDWLYCMDWLYQKNKHLNAFNFSFINPVKILVQLFIKSSSKPVRMIFWYPSVG
jgi:hypothetical protein